MNKNLLFGLFGLFFVLVLSSSVFAVPILSINGGAIADTSTYSFGNVYTNDSMVLLLNISNVGDEDLIIDSFSCDGSAQFPSCSTSRFTIDCSGVTIPAGDSYYCSINFSPQSFGYKYDEISIVNNGGFSYFAVDGSGLITGAGSIGDPYKIFYCGDLLAVNSFPSDDFVLMNNIDCSDGTSSCYIDGAGFCPLVPFSGDFDGNNYLISNVGYTGINYNGGSSIGLFSSSSGVIHDVGLINPSIFGVDVDSIGNNYVGGLVGSNSGIINNCFVSGASITGGDTVGGLVGFSSGLINNSYSFGTVTADSTVGGLVGNSGNIDNSFSSATVVASGAGTLGGLVGSVDAGNIVSNSFSNGSVTGDFGAGLVGYLNTATIIYSYSTGLVSGTNNGGLLATNDGGTITDSFWDNETSGQLTSDGGIGLSTAEMKTEGSFTNWDFITTWQICSEELSGYPSLQSLFTACPFTPPCSESWVQDLPDSCDGVINNFTITYYDSNMCNTSLDLPMDNGTITDCCIENWSQQLPNACDGLLDDFIIYYDDFGMCNTTFTLPIDNNTVVDCCIESWLPSYNPANCSFGNVTERLLSYTDSGVCNTTFTLPVDNNTLVGCVCTELWSPYYTSCTGTQMLYYLDAHVCGTDNDLPLDNGTISSCTIQYAGTGSGGIPFVRQSAITTTSTTATTTSSVNTNALTNFFNGIIQWFQDLFAWLGR